jgi:hypothetical protein
MLPKCNGASVIDPEREGHLFERRSNRPGRAVLVHRDPGTTGAEAGAEKGQVETLVIDHAERLSEN